MNLLAKKQNRFIQIDALRGIAAVVVVLHHYLFIYGRDFNRQQLLPQVFEHGYFGVELFFIISGFVIYYSISKSASIKTFLLKRAIRLYPIYWICLIITFVAIQIFPLSVSRNTNFKEALLGLTMFNGLFKGVKSVDPSYWSLLIEWFFYIMIAVVFAINKNKEKIKLFLWGWLVLILFYNLVYKIPVIGAFFNLRYGPLFIAGICFYYIYALNEQTFHNWLLLTASYVAAMVSLQDLYLLFPALTVIFLLVIVALHFNFKFFQNSMLLFLGKISYALYLIHQNLGFIIMELGHKAGIPFFISVIGALSISILIAFLLTNYIEQPISNKLKKVLSIK